MSGAGTVRRRDPAALAEGLTAWLRATRSDSGDRRVASVVHASAGLSNETLVVELDPDAPPGGQPERIVVRMPPVEPSFPDYDLGMQAAVHEVVAAAGVPAPVPVVLEEDESWLGAPFLVMPYVAGHVPGAAPAFDPWVMESGADRQRRLHDAFVDVLARLHRIDWEPTGVGGVVRGAGLALDDELAWWGEYLAWASAGRPRPELTRALAWCTESRPAEQPPPALLWGDPRLGNLVVDEQRRVLAVLDWELATIGPPEMDLGWHLGLTSIADELLDERVPGFPDRAATIARYEERLGRPVVDIEWHELFALTRALAVNDRQARMAEARSGRSRPADREDPLLAILARRITAAG